MARSTMALPFASYPVIASVTALGNIAANFLKFSSALFAVCILICPLGLSSLIQCNNRVGETFFSTNRSGVKSLFNAVQQHFQFIFRTNFKGIFRTLSNRDISLRYN